MVRELRWMCALRRLTQERSRLRFGVWVGSVPTALALAALPMSSLAITYASSGELRDDCAAILSGAMRLKQDSPRTGGCGRLNQTALHKRGVGPRSGRVKRLGRARRPVRQGPAVSQV